MWNRKSSKTFQEFEEYEKQRQKKFNRRGNFLLLYVLKMSLRRGGGQKSPKTPLRSLNMVPYKAFYIENK